MKKTKRKKYKGLGFVELLISLAVAAIAVTVLMNMTTTSMKEAIRYERHDALTRLAMDGALIIRRHAERANDPQDTTTTPAFDPVKDTCYKILLEEDDAVVDFHMNIDYGTPPNYHDKLIGNDNFHTDIIYGQGPDLGDTYYFAYCVDKDDDDLYIGKIVTGFVDCNSCGVEPYEQAIIVSVPGLP